MQDAFIYLRTNQRPAWDGVVGSGVFREPCGANYVIRTLASHSATVWRGPCRAALSDNLRSLASDQIQPSPGIRGLRFPTNIS